MCSVEELVKEVAEVLDFVAVDVGDGDVALCWWEGEIDGVGGRCGVGSIILGRRCGWGACKGSWVSNFCDGC
jgi:hypothetical protein